MTHRDTAPTTPGSGRLLVLVEDSPMQRRVLGDFLREQGFAVEAVASAAEARERLVHARPHAVICDVVMPGMDGFALCRAIKNDPAVAGIPVLLVTSTDVDDSDERLAERAGAEGLVPRTPGFGLLFESLLACLDRRGAGRRGESVVDELRARFLADGRAETPRVGSALEDDESLEEAETFRTVHRWAGRGSTLGFPAISREARALETAVERGDRAGARGALAALDRLFRETDPAEAVGERSAEIPAAAVPPSVAQGLAGRRVALVGFTPAEAERMADTFALAGARAEPLAWRAGLAASPAMSPHDLVVLAALGAPPAAPWLAAGAMEGCDAPLLVVGETESLLQAASTLPEHQLLVAPWTPESLLLRSYLAIRGAAGNGAAPEGDGAPREVVIADDDPTILVLLEATLRNYGYRSHLVEDGAQAIEVARRVRPRALIVDINMPGRDGYEVLSTLRGERATRSIPILLLTARHQEADIIRAFDLGASEYMVKPFNPMELVARLRRLVER